MSPTLTLTLTLTLALTLTRPRTRTRTLTLPLPLPLTLTALARQFVCQCLEAQPAYGLQAGARSVSERRAVGSGERRRELREHRPQHRLAHV